MKAKCYAIYNGDQEIVSEYANASQKNFLSFELVNVIKKAKKTERVESERTSNGVWYFKTTDKTKTLHLLLLASEAASLPAASSLITKGMQFELSKISLEKMRMKLAEQLKLFNANAKMQNLNSNVMELQNLMKGNVNKIISNMSDLDTAEQKSERLNSMSRQFETDSRALEDKMKRQACMRKLIIGGVGGCVLVFLVYYFFL